MTLTALLLELAHGEERAVLITRWPAPTPWTEPAPPEALWTRAHAWAFEPAT